MARLSYQFCMPWSEYRRFRVELCKELNSLSHYQTKLLAKLVLWKEPGTVFDDTWDGWSLIDLCPLKKSTHRMLDRELSAMSKKRRRSLLERSPAPSTNNCPTVKPQPSSSRCQSPQPSSSASQSPQPSSSASQLPQPSSSAGLRRSPNNGGNSRRSPSGNQPNTPHSLTSKAAAKLKKLGQKKTVHVKRLSKAELERISKEQIKKAKADKAKREASRLGKSGRNS